MLLVLANITEFGKTEMFTTEQLAGNSHGHRAAFSRHGRCRCWHGSLPSVRLPSTERCRTQGLPMSEGEGHPVGGQRSHNMT